jgi:hypothetical protein
MPRDTLFIPALAKDLNLLLSTEVGLASKVISILLSNLANSLSFPIIFSTIKLGIKEGVPPPKNIETMFLFFRNSA